MCWVMPPNSCETTSVLRMASSRSVLPWSQATLVDLFLFLELLLEADHLGLVPQLRGDEGDGLVRERLRRGDHLSQRQEDLHDVGGGPAHLLGEVLRAGASNHLEG